MKKHFLWLGFSSALFCSAVAVAETNTTITPVERPISRMTQMAHQTGNRDMPMMMQCPRSGNRDDMPMMRKMTNLPMMMRHQMRSSHSTCSTNALFCTTVKSTNPVETIKNLATVIPDTNGQQYQVTVSVTPLKMKRESKPNSSVTTPPSN